MSTTTFKVNFTEKSIGDIKFVRKEVFEVNLATIDVIYAKGKIEDLENVNITNIQDKDMLMYNLSEEKWKNKQVISIDNDIPCINIDY